MERKYLFPHFSMSNRTLEKCLIKFTFTTRSKWKWICSRISFTHCFLYAFPFLRNNFRCLGRKHFMKYYFEGNFISDFRLTLSPLCAIYANDTQKRTCVIQVSLFLAVFPHFSHQKHVKTLGENTIVQETIYRRNEMVSCFENCSNLLWEKNALVIEKNFCKFDYQGRYFIPTVKSQRNKICAFLKLRYCEKATKLLSNIKTSRRFLWPFQKTWYLLFNGGFIQIYYIGPIKMPIITNNWDIETYRKKLEKKIVNTYSFFFSGKCLWLCLWKLGPPVSRRLPSRSWRGSSWGHSIEKFDSWYEKRYEQYQTILDPVTLWIMQVWNCYDFFQILYISFVFHMIWKRIEIRLVRFLYKFQHKSFFMPRSQI